MNKWAEGREVTTSNFGETKGLTRGVHKGQGKR